MTKKAHQPVSLNIDEAKSFLSHIVTNGIKLKADRLYKLLVDGGLILGCVMLVRWQVCEAVLFY
jgi:hypothetical protein